MTDVCKDTAKRERHLASDAYRKERNLHFCSGGPSVKYVVCSSDYLMECTSTSI